MYKKICSFFLKKSVDRIIILSLSSCERIKGMNHDIQCTFICIFVFIWGSTLTWKDYFIVILTKIIL